MEIVTIFLVLSIVVLWVVVLPLWMRVRQMRETQKDLEADLHRTMLRVGYRRPDPLD